MAGGVVLNQEREREGGYFKDMKECVTFFCSSGLAALQAFHFAKAQFSELFICIFKERAQFLIYFSLSDEFLYCEVQQVPFQFYIYIQLYNGNFYPKVPA